MLPLLKIERVTDEVMAMIDVVLDSHLACCQKVHSAMKPRFLEHHIIFFEPTPAPTEKE
jgi:hypothetical protein